jgi:hypothetical protein
MRAASSPRPYSNTCWQNGFLDKAIDIAWGGSLIGLAHQLDPHLIGYQRLSRDSNPKARSNP